MRKCRTGLERALFTAAAEGDLERVRELIQSGANVNSKDRFGKTALMRPAENGHMDVVRFMVESGADFNIKTTYGSTVLRWAAESGHLDVVRFLVERGANVNAKTTNKETALMWAARNGHTNVVHFLIERGAEFNAKAKDGWTALAWAARNGHVDVVRLLSEHGADVNNKTVDGETALMWAADNGHLNVVRLLIERCADVNAKTTDGWIALMRDDGYGHKDVVRFLTKLSAGVNVKDMFGKTALMRAVGNGHMDVVRLLRECGTNVNAEDDERKALWWAAENGHIDVVRFLIERGDDVDAKTSGGETAVMRAADNNHANIVRYLVANGASTSTRNQDGDTAIRIAARKGHQEVVRILAPLEKTSQRQLNEGTSRVTSSLVSHQSSKIISPLEIELQQLIDVGNLGGDYRARWLDAEVVVKLFVSNALTATFAEEVHLWQQLRHPNVIKLYGACDDGIFQVFVCEYASNGSLDEYLKSSHAGRRLPWQYLCQAALGLEFLHERKIVHGDLRCRNILVGSDGLVKLANFGLSASARTVASANSAQMVKDSKRWQSPERLRGEEASFASDVYSLGMCIVEAVTGDIPWGGRADYKVNYLKRNWKPEDDCEADENEPRGIYGDALALVQRMCCQDPEKRLNITSVVYELECLSVKEGALAQGGSSHSTTETTVSTIDTYKNGEVIKRWEEIQNIFDEHGNLSHLSQALEDLRELLLRLKTGMYRQPIMRQFDGLVGDFHNVIKTLASTEQSRIMQLSATRTTTHSIHAFHRRIKVLWRMLNDSTYAAHEREERWAQQRSRQLEFFVSEVSKTWLLLNELESAEERSAFLDFLKHEMEMSDSNYSEGQLAVMQKAYDEVASHVGTEAHTTSTPAWFIPWYELQLDQSSGCLGRGGFGSVHRAKWLDSDVVVKQVMSETRSSGFLGPSWESRSQSRFKAPTTDDPSAKAKRAETMEMFKREADIWFGLSHPHVVRLFGACHVGSPFFVCEFATNGTLVAYLRQHPDELWRLLHEAALGVQYLHERGIVHGDLKGNNVVIGSDKKAKVTDFGLSSTVDVLDESSAQITDAWHWVAPECLAVENARPTAESDVFSLGMCVIEAMRVVASLQHGTDRTGASPLPWGGLDNRVVKGHLSRGNLPLRPIGCSDDEWSLVTRMCCHDPARRLKISTVVDELDALRSSAAEESVSGVKKLDGKSVLEAKQLPEVLSAMKKLMKTLCGNGLTRFSRKLKKNLLGRVDGRVKIWYLYLSLWKRIELVHAHIVASQQIGFRYEKLCMTIEDARVQTFNLPDLNHTLREMTEAALHGYALHRRLDKLIVANSLCETETEWSRFRNWKEATNSSPP